MGPQGVGPVLGWASWKVTASKGSSKGMPSPIPCDIDISRGDDGSVDLSRNIAYGKGPERTSWVEIEVLKLNLRSSVVNRPRCWLLPASYSISVFALASTGRGERVW
eukprot:4828520-Pyramimonas_sp.AAC.2